MARVSFGSCFQPTRDPVGVKGIIGDCVAFFNQGDCPYTNSVPDTSFGDYSITEHSGDDFTEANFTRFHDYYRAAPSIAWISANMLHYYIPDDHEYPGDNWDHTVTQAETGSGGMTGADQADVDTAYLNAITAASAYMTDNPANTDAEAVAQAPSEADAAASNYQPRYFRVTHGDCEYFMLDCISHRSPIPGGVTMLGTAQKTWLKNHLKSSTATYKAIVSGKKTYPASFDNADIWSYYDTERDEILAHIDNATDWAAPGGVFWIAGDRHTPQVIASYKNANTQPPHAGGDTYDHVCVVSCPIGKPVTPTPEAAQNNVLFVAPQWGQVVTTGEDKDGYYEISVYRMNGAQKVWTSRIYAGENKLSYSPDYGKYAI